MKESGYLQAFQDIARIACAPFWWYGTDAAGVQRILHNGTICFVRTRERQFAVTACHVFDEYAADLEIDSDLHCQFGNATIQPERQVIDQSRDLDLVTFDVSSVQAAGIGVDPHVAVQWPTRPIEATEALLYGGLPGSLRTEASASTDVPFQWFIGGPLSSTASYLKLHIDFEKLQLATGNAYPMNTVLGGLSGAPVFRFVPSPIERIELAAFITESGSDFGVILARPSHCVRPHGALDHDAAA